MTGKKDTKQRCSWAETDPLLAQYHDEEWGVPEYDSRALWELLMLEGFQAGLSWLTVLRKREAFRKAFRRFDPAKVARFTETDIQRLLDDPGIIRARAKIEATIKGAQIFLEMKKSGEDFASLRESYRSSGYDRTARIEHLSAETASGLRKNTRRMREEDNEKQ